MVFFWHLSFLLISCTFSLAQHSDSIPSARATHPHNGLVDPYSQAVSHLSKIKRRPTVKVTSLTVLAGQFIRSLFFHKPESSSPNAIKVGSPLHTAVELLKLSASEGNPDAIYVLADMNFFGNYSHPRNFAEAYNRYHQLAHLNGNSSAQFMVGFFHSTGFGDVVKKNQANALLHYTAAAEQGNERAQMAVAYIHTVAIGAPQSCPTSVLHYRNVALKAMKYIESGPVGGNFLHKTSQRISDSEGGIYGEGASVSSAGHNARHNSPISDAHASTDDVLEYLELQSRKGDAKATLALGRMHYEGAKGLKPNYHLAKGYFFQVARQYWSKDGKIKKDASSNIEKLASRAAGYLGRMFLRGEGVEQSSEIAKTWLNRGNENSDSISQYYLGLMHLDGVEVKENPQKAADLFLASADQGYAPAQVSAGKLFLDHGDVATALKYFDLASKMSNVEAFYYLGELVMGGHAGEVQCDLANTYFKLVAEKAEPIVSSLEEANWAYNAGDTDLALLEFMIAAEQGFEMAQTNVAFLIDKQSRTSIFTQFNKLVPAVMSLFPESYSLPISSSNAFLYWSRSARQFNIDSLLKMGDYYYYGIGRSSDQDKAAACYQTAAETLYSAQAAWNLGWMYENGKGGVEQDFHLAKRYYDQALEINKEAYLAVKLALVKLRLRSRWNEWTRGPAKSIQDERVKRKPSSFSEWLSNLLEADAVLHEHDHGRDEDAIEGGIGSTADDWDDRLAAMSDEELWAELMSDLFETAAIIGLAIALAVLVIYRRHRADQQRRREQQQQPAARQEPNEQRNAQAQPDRGLFPQPGEAAFMDWAVGGVGH